MTLPFFCVSDRIDNNHSLVPRPSVCEGIDFTKVGQWANVLVISSCL